MYLRLETLTEKKLLGSHVRMSLAQNQTGMLWRSFGMKRREVKNSVDSLRYSIEIYNATYFDNFSPGNEFDKWAALEVTDFDTIPEGMETITLPGGLYAVFLHKGNASMGPTTFQYIFGSWLPGSEFVLDNRPHFEVMGEKYKNEDPDSEEELWVPIKPKGQWKR